MTDIRNLDDQPTSSAKFFNFDNYSDALAKVICGEGTGTPLVIGILGEWGSGKTSLMKTVEHKIKNLIYIDDIKSLDGLVSKLTDASVSLYLLEKNHELKELLENYKSSSPQVDDKLKQALVKGLNKLLEDPSLSTVQSFEHLEWIQDIKKVDLFGWDEIPGNDSVRLIDFLKQKFSIDWVKTAKVEKIDNGKTIRVSTEKKFLLLKLNNEKTKLNLEIDDGRTYELITKTEHGKLNIYENPKFNNRFLLEEILIGIIKYPRKLANNLKDAKGSLSQYILKEFSEEELELLEMYDGSHYPSKKLQNTMVNVLYRLFNDPSLYNEKRFAEVYLDDVIQKLYLFSWDEFQGNDSVRLIDFLKQKFSIDWVKTAKIEKIDNGKTIKLSTEKNFLLLKLNNEKTKLNLEIDDSRTYELIAKTEHDKLNIYKKLIDFKPQGLDLLHLNRLLLEKAEIINRHQDPIIISEDMVNLNNLYNLNNLLLKLQNAPLFSNIIKKFSLGTQKNLYSYDCFTSPLERMSLQRTMADELNRILRGPCIYDEKIFKRVDLTEKTKKLIKQNPRGEEDRIRLNRLLLEDAFPSELLIFNSMDLKDPSGLATKLQSDDTKDPVSMYIIEKNHELKKLLENYKSSSPEVDDKLKQALVKGLNSILEDSSFLEEQYFAEVNFDKEIKKLMKKKPNGVELIRLNRRLLEEVYPNEIKRSFSSERDDYPVRTIWFNAWKYDKKDELWRSLMMRILEELKVPDEQRPEHKLRNVFSAINKEDIINPINLFEKLWNASLMFHINDLKDMNNLVYRLLDEQNPLSRYLKNQFSPETINLLDKYDGLISPTQEFKKALVNEFNNLLLQSNYIYDINKKHRFAEINEEIKLTEKTQRIIKQEPKGKDLKRLNRLLLEEAYWDDSLNKSIEELQTTLYQDIYREDPGSLEFKPSKAIEGTLKLGLSALPMIGIPTLNLLNKSDGTDAFKALSESIQRDKKIEHIRKVQSTEEFQLRFEKIINKYYIKRNKRVVVFIDDLDRCLPEKALEVLETIKLFLDVKGCIFVLGIDRRVISYIIRQKYRDLIEKGEKKEEGDKKEEICYLLGKLIEKSEKGPERNQEKKTDSEKEEVKEVKREETHITGENYLEKIIQLSFQLPPLTEEGMKDFIKTELEIPDFYKNKPYIDMIVKGIDPNPRKIKRLINTMELMRNLADSIPEFQKEFPDKDSRIRCKALLMEWAIISNYHSEFQKAVLKKIWILFHIHEYLQSKLKKDPKFDISKKPEDIPPSIEQYWNNKRVLEMIKAFQVEIVTIPGLKEIERVITFSKHVLGGETQAGVIERKEVEDIIESGGTLKRKDMQGVDLSDMNFRKVDLSYSDLTGADLRKATMEEADLRKATMEEANLSEANLSDAVLSGTKLINANLNNARLVHANLNDADLTKADLSDADLSDAELEGADLSRANLSKANLTGTNLSGAKTKLINANLYNATLSRSELMEANLNEAKLVRANLDNANLTKANLTNAKLNNATLNHAKLIGAFLNDVKLKDAELHSSDLSKADLTGVDLYNSQLVSANMKGTIMKRCNLRQCNLKNAEFDVKTDFTGIYYDDVTIKSLENSKWEVAIWDPWVLEEIKKVHGKKETK